jgi:type II secretory pathway component PulL
MEKAVIQQILERLKSYQLDPVFITSIELAHMLKEFSPSTLLSSVVLDEHDRIDLAVNEMKAPSINLRRDEFSYTRDIKKTKKSLRLTVILLVSIILVLASDMLIKIIAAKQEANSLKNEIRRQYQDMFPTEKNIMNELLQLKSHIKELKNKEEIFVGVEPLNILLTLSYIEKSGIAFNEISIEINSIVMKGEAPSLSDIQQLKTRLENYLDAVTITDSKSTAQNQMLFSITAKERKG